MKLELYTPDHLSHSSVRTFRKCPRRFALEKLWCLRAKNTTPVVHPGSLFHEGIARYRLTRDLDEALEAVSAAAQLVMDQPGSNTDDAAKYKALVRAALRGYVALYPDSERWDFQSGAIEFRDRNPSYQPPKAFVLDAVAREKDTDNWWVFEEKTTGSLSLAREEILPIDEQVQGYYLDCRDVLGRTPLGCIFTQVRIDRRCRLSKLDRGSYVDFERRMTKRYLTEPEVFYYRGQPFRYRESEVAAAERTYRGQSRLITNSIKEVKEGCPLLEAFPGNYSECLYWFGRICDYVPVCVSGASPSGLHAFVQDNPS